MESHGPAEGDVTRSDPGSSEAPALSFVDLEPVLHEEAIAAAGCDDFGDPSYREGLRAVLEAFDRDARFHRRGRRLARGMIVHLLTQRLRSERLWREHPEVLAHEIRRPIFIVGCVRTGSTALHYLMGEDPQLQRIEWWLAARPQPRPPRETWEDHPDFQASQAEMDAMFAADPSLRAMHFTTAAGPEECRHFLAQSFTDDCFEVNATVPSYEAWYHQGRHLESYRRHKQLVQLVGANDPVRRWLLKYPVHLRQLDSLLEVYPDACIVQTHRHPLELIPSYANMVAAYRALWERDIDREDIARRQLAGWAHAANGALEVRDRHPSAQFFDLYFEDFLADRVGSVRRIYQHFGQPFPPETEAALHRHAEENPRDKHGRHAYSARGSGLTEREIRDAFGPYLERFFPS
jgi:hypothetical protein